MSDPRYQQVISTLADVENELLRSRFNSLASNSEDDLDNSEDDFDDSEDDFDDSEDDLDDSEDDFNDSEDDFDDHRIFDNVEDD